MKYFIINSSKEIYFPSHILNFIRVKEENVGVWEHEGRRGDGGGGPWKVGDTELHFLKCSCNLKKYLIWLCETNQDTNNKYNIGN